MLWGYWSSLIILINLIGHKAISSKIPFNLINHDSVTLSKIALENKKINIANICTACNIVDIFFSIPQKVFNFKFALNIPVFKETKLIYIGKKDGANITSQYNKIIYLSKLLILLKEEKTLVEQSLVELNQLSSIESIFIDNIHRLKKQLLEINYQIEQIPKQIQFIMQDLQNVCHIANDKNLQNKDYYIAPFIRFNKKKILKFLLKSFYYQKYYNDVMLAISGNPSIYYMELRIDKYVDNDLLGNQLSLNSNLKRIITMPLSNQLKSKYLMDKLLMKIKIKYIRIKTYYAILKKNKSKNYILNYILCLKQRVAILELQSTKSIYFIFKIHKLKTQILQLKKQYLEKQYQSIQYTWKIMLEIVPINYLEFVFTIKPKTL